MGGGVADQVAAVSSDWPHGLFGARQEALFGTLRGILDRVNDYPACRRFADLPASVRHDVGADLADVLALMAGGRGLKPLLSFLMRLPAPVLARLQKEIATAMATPDMKAFAEGMGADPRQVGSDVFGRMLKDSTEAWGKVAANTAFERQ